MTYNHSLLISVLEDYLRLSGTCPIMFGQEVANDEGLVVRVRNGMTLPDVTAHPVLDRIMSDLEWMIADVEIRAGRTGNAEAQGIGLIPAHFAALRDFNTLVEAYA